MRILCYGASVTAQKDKGGYFYHLERLAPEYEFNRIAYGASHFDYAGFGFSKEVIEKKPDICLIDWLTPSMKIFSLDKIRRLNVALLTNGILPIWINFPRKDDLHNERACFEQVRSCCREFGVPFWNISEIYPSFVNECQQYLRDIVHTTNEGAELYAKLLKWKLDEILGSFSELPSINEDISLPNLFDVDLVINQEQVLELELNVQDPFLEVMLETQIGPDSCLIEVFLKADSEIIASKVVNPCDAWCYYSRNMILPPIKFSTPPGLYTLSIKYKKGEPLENIVLRKPLELAVESRSLPIYRASINAELIYLK